jgi:hypothetical protein
MNDRTIATGTIGGSYDSAGSRIWVFDPHELRRLRASLAAYRLVFGQPRQEDLIAYLGDRMPLGELAAWHEKLRIDLTPRKA